MAGSSSFAFFFYKNCLIILNIFYLVVSLILIVAPAVAIGDAKFTNVPIVGGVIASGVFLLIVAIVGLIGAVRHHQVLLFFYIIALGILFIILFSVSVAALAVNSSQRHALLEHTWKGFNKHDKAEVQSFFDCCGFDEKSQHKNLSDPLGHPPCYETIEEVPPPKCCKSQFEVFVGEQGSPTNATLMNATLINSTSASPTPSSKSSTPTMVTLTSGNGTAPIKNTTSSSSTSAKPSAKTESTTNTTAIPPPCGCQPCYNAWSDQVASAFKIGGGIGLFFSLTELFGLILTIYYRNKKDPTANPNAFL